MTWLRAGSPGIVVRLRTGKKFVFPQALKAYAGAQRVSYTMDTTDTSPGTPLMRRKSPRSLHLQGRVRTHSYNGTAYYFKNVNTRVVNKFLLLWDREREYYRARLNKTRSLDPSLK